MATTVPSLDNLIDNYLQCCTAEGKSRKTIEWYEAIREKDQEESRACSALAKSGDQRFHPL